MKTKHSFINRIIYLIGICIFFLCKDALPQSQWAWIGGNKFLPSPVYGIMGVPSISNKPQAVYEGARWTDKDGNFWIFGQDVDDMWRYNPYTQEWTWMRGTHVSYLPPNYGTQGVASPSNFPGGRHFCVATWTDNNNDLWLFGGETTFDNAKRSDLWKYNIATNMWTWVRGPSVGNATGVFGVKGIPSTLNDPPCRTETACQWVDNNNDLWLFGGLGVAQLDHNDMWRYNIATNMWTWMAGSSLGNATASYGIKGVASPTNAPAGRAVYTPFKDVNGNFFVFGGFNNVAYSPLNDVWKYDPTTNLWTWVGGLAGPNQTSNFTTTCSPDTIQYPWGRIENRATWAFGNHFINFGGMDIQHGFFSDVWSFDATCYEWTWMSGVSNAGMSAVFGIKGVPSATNTPVSDFGSFSFQDSLGNCFLFGGWSSGNQLWQYYPDTSCWASSPCGQQGAAPIVNFSSTDSIWCEKDCINFTDLSTNNPTSWVWTFGGANPDTSTAQNPQGICFNNYGTYNVQLIACNSLGCDTLLLNNFITVLQSPPLPTVTYSNDTLYSSPAFAYQWYNIPLPIPGANQQYYVPTLPGSYYVVIFDTNGCFSSSPTFVISSVSDLENNALRINPNPVTDDVVIHLPGSITDVTVLIYDANGREVHNQNIPSIKLTDSFIQVDCSAFKSGVYLIKLISKEQSWLGKFVKE